MFSQRLLQLRKESGLTQQQTANMIQITLRQYQRFEKGDQKPGYDNLVKLADCFQVSLDYLVGRSASKQILP